MNVNQVIAYRIDVYDDGRPGDPHRFETGNDLHQALRAFDSLHSTTPVHEDGDRREGWMNLIAVTSRADDTGTLLEQRRWDR